MPQKIGEGPYQVLDTVEKPSLRKHLQTWGLWKNISSPLKYFSALEKTSVGKRREDTTTDGLKILLVEEPIYAY